MKHIVDSSVWLEYFADGKNARHFSPVIEAINHVLVPSIIIYEVYKKVLHERDESTALEIIAHLQQGQVIDLNLEIAILAAKISSQERLPMADSIILATAQLYNAIIWTQDADFEGIKGVKYFRK